MRERVTRELRWLGLGFGVPFLVLVGFDLATTRSSLPWWQRLAQLEDVCSYGICVVIPLLSYLVVRGGVAAWPRSGT